MQDNMMHQDVLLATSIGLISCSYILVGFDYQIRMNKKSMDILYLLPFNFLGSFENSPNVYVSV
jgi:hypothetical protein